jgi:nucleoside-diphosphate-sugar epimerase
MRILVTGAAGFIGSHLTDRLLADGHEVIGLDAFVPHYARSIKEDNLAVARQYDRFRFVEMDLRDARLTEYLADADVVVHQAAMAGSASWDRFDTYVEHNFVATQRLVKELVSVDATRRRLVLISTSSVYGTVAFGDESTLPCPANPYGVTKLAAEQLGLAYYHTFGLPVVILRYFSIYGPRQRPDMAYHIFIEALRRDEPITIFGDGEQTRGNTYIDDCIAGTILAIDRGRAGETYNLGGGMSISVNRALDILERAVGRPARRHYTAARPGDPRHTLADISKAREQLCFDPQVQPEAGLPSQVAWHESRHSKV